MQIAPGNGTLPSGWREKILPASSLVSTGGSDVGDADLPCIHNLTVKKRLVARSRDLHDNGSVAQVKESEDVRNLCVGSQKFVTRLSRMREGDDVVLRNSVRLKSAITEESHTYRRHCPDNSFDASLINDLLIPALRRRRTKRPKSPKRQIL